METRTHMRFVAFAPCFSLDLSNQFIDYYLLSKHVSGWCIINFILCWHVMVALKNYLMYTDYMVH